VTMHHSCALCLLHDITSVPCAAFRCLFSMGVSICCSPGLPRLLCCCGEDFGHVAAVGWCVGWLLWPLRVL